jgi:maltooligosyltrehalose trehalohydrolase
VTRRLGATPHADGSCTFEVWAPHAERVRVRIIDVSDPEHAHVYTRTLEPLERGYHSARLPGVPAGTQYAFRLDDDDAWLPDPASASQPQGVHEFSEVVDHDAFAWSDDAWHGVPLRDYVIYELHVGTFTPEGTFDAVIPRLEQLAADGITAIELLPVAQFPGGRNWGYDGVDLFATQSTYGGPEGLRRLVDAAHARGIAVVLDVVYNHLGPEGNYLGKFGPYHSSLHHTPWGEAMNVDGAGSDEVRRFFIENAQQWVRDFHIDALRLDAIHGIVDTSASPFLAELAEAVEEVAEAANRRAWLIAESDLNDPRTITPREAGGTGLHSQWTDDFHHALHVAVTGERDGYYADYDGLPHLARSMREAFVYAGEYSVGRGRRHGASVAGMPGERFVVYAQNHDQVGNRLAGDRLAATLDLDRRKLTAATVLLSPFVPMLFMGEEYGEQRPFPYFVSHTDPELVEAVRAGRAREFALEGVAPDPQAEQTFASAVLDWESREEGERRQLLDFHRELLRLRRESAALTRLRPAEVSVRLLDDARLLLLERSAGDERVLVALRFGSASVELGKVLPDAGQWHRLLDSDDPRFGGKGVDAARIGATGATVFRRAAATPQGDER